MTRCMVIRMASLVFFVSLLFQSSFISTSLFLFWRFHGFLTASILFRGLYSYSHHLHFLWVDVPAVLFSKDTTDRSRFFAWANWRFSGNRLGFFGLVGSWLFFFAHAKLAWVFICGISKSDVHDLNLPYFTILSALSSNPFSLVPLEIISSVSLRKCASYVVWPRRIETGIASHRRK
jgi:hypothetical protein